MGDLQGRTVLVTGGSRGLGWEMVRGFAGQGADVVIVSRKQHHCDERAELISNEFGVRAFARACNVGDWADCDALIHWVEHEVGELDVLVNNAGMSPLYPSVDQVGESLFDKVIATNLKGPFRLSAALGTRMAAGRGGSIINISSIEAGRPTATAVPYSAAKAGLNAMTVGLAQALAPKVRVNAIQAGPFRTDISNAWGPEAFEQIAQSFALARAGQPDEIVGAALFFATDASAYCTGSILRVDGGPR
ncbi:MAG TPA: SDR family oxidoreductase [Nocardioides sp.]|nr:SDR family oxidoreductase [Nocardioides sp.]